MIRVLVVDDHTLVREGLCRLLEAMGGCQSERMPREEERRV